MAGAAYEGGYSLTFLDINLCVEQFITKDLNIFDIIKLDDPRALGSTKCYIRNRRVTT